MERQNSREVEEELSEFHEEPRESLVAPGDFFSTEGSPAFPFRFPETRDNIFNRILSLSYRWLDSIANPRGHLFVRHREEVLEPYYDLLRLLYYKEHIIKGENFLLKRYNDVPRLYRVDIMHSYPPGITDGRVLNVRSFARGGGRDIAEALSTAIGEFLERYFLTLYHKKNLISGSPLTLTRKGYQMINLAALAGFSEEQQKDSASRSWDEKSILRWEKATCLSTKETVLVPAQLVYWNYIHDEGEPFLREQNTNGCGGMFTREGSILSGLYELVQRDAFLIHWLNAISPPKVDPATVPDAMFQKILRESQRYGFEVHCLNTTLDTGIPSVAIIIEDLFGHFPLFSFGAGCDPAPEKALRRALMEAWFCYYFLRASFREPLEPPKDYKPFRDTSINQVQRLQLFCNPSLRQRYQFLMDGETKSFDEHYPHRNKFSSQEEELAAAVRQIENLGPGYEAYAFTACHRVLSRIGYFSSRVIVPALVPLYLTETHPPLGAKRIQGVPKKLGLRHSGQINQWPHPFP